MKTLREMMDIIESAQVVEGANHNVGDTVNYSTKVPGFSKSAKGGQGKITKKTATTYTVNGIEMPHGHVKSKAQEEVAEETQDPIKKIEDLYKDR